MISPCQQSRCDDGGKDDGAVILSSEPRRPSRDRGGGRRHAARALPADAVRNLGRNWSASPRSWWRTIERFGESSRGRVNRRLPIRWTTWRTARAGVALRQCVKAP